jgi:pimeloyl-ACP methyl ester carboxylesterase
MRIFLGGCALFITAAAAPIVHAETPSLTAATGLIAPLNWPLPTLGGEQFWSDEHVYQGWRIQHNALTDHYRLLDPRDVRRAWGTQQQCQVAFEEVKQREKLPPLDGRAVVTLHGLFRSRDHMEGIGRYLAEHGDFHWVNVSYASTRQPLEDHAQSLARIIDGLEGIDEIHFACHSMGNLVVRRYLAEADQQEPRWRPDPRIKRMVMLGPPNNGAELAVRLKDSDFLALIFGPSAEQIARQWSDTQKLLATPSFPFAVLAGGCGDDCGLNPFIKGDDDAIVSVEETRLAGASDFRVVNCLHAAMLSDPRVQQMVLSFLEHGYFTSDGERQPIPAQTTTPEKAAGR